MAGLDIATPLAGKCAHGRHLNIALIDRAPAYVWKPMLHTIAACTSEASAQQIVYGAYGARLGFGTTARSPWDRPPCQEGEAYDTLVLTVGSRANDFGTPGGAELTARIDTRSDAIAFNDRLRAGLTLAGRP